LPDALPNEGAFVSIPADGTVGIGRSAEETAGLKTRVQFLEDKLGVSERNECRSQPNETMPRSSHQFSRLTVELFGTLFRRWMPCD
jgi:hypothetical protein